MIVGLATLIAIYIAFVAKQFLCDFLLQTTWMARGKERSAGWLRPLAAHVGIHAAGTLAIALVAAPQFWFLALVDIAVHGCIDRGKALASRGTPPTEPRFWWLLGADQALHQLTHFAYVLLLAGVVRPG